ncbi:MAG: TetR/AcrR family transcriptional regulator [Gammaproteobacteria bacterium]|nr:TetR/AcrR family transcriptional regulator [Gammaproteobacteria bacterium]
MAQRSKKDHIVACALPLFLANGYKGTSIDLVVKESAVSKPTVYNHFPDKAALILAVMKQWAATHKPKIPAAKDLPVLDLLIDGQWLTWETVGLYALVIGEGRRFPQARKVFWEQFDQRWRQLFIMTFMRADPQVEMYIDQQLMNRLKQL